MKYLVGFYNNENEPVKCTITDDSVFSLVIPHNKENTAVEKSNDVTFNTLFHTIPDSAKA